jgi:hypothetical protein
MTEQDGTELVYRYAIPSPVPRTDNSAANSSELLLPTSGGITTEPIEGQDRKAASNASVDGALVGHGSCRS